MFLISAASNLGLTELINFTAQCIDKNFEPITFEEDYVEIPTVKSKFVIEKTAPGYYKISGKAIEKMMGYTNLDTERGLNFFKNICVKTALSIYLRKMVYPKATQLIF